MWYVKSAEQTAHSLLQVFVGPEYKIIDMPSFYGALVEALCAALSRAGRIVRRRRSLLGIRRIRYAGASTHGCRPNSRLTQPRLCGAFCFWCASEATATHWQE
jgi:hypothetical protein